MLTPLSLSVTLSLSLTHCSKLSDLFLFLGNLGFNFLPNIALKENHDYSKEEKENVMKQLSRAVDLQALDPKDHKWRFCYEVNCIRGPCSSATIIAYLSTTKMSITIKSQTGHMAIVVPSIIVEKNYWPI